MTCYVMLHTIINMNMINVVLHWLIRFAFRRGLFSSKAVSSHTPRHDETYILQNI